MKNIKKAEKKTEKMKLTLTAYGFL